MSKIISEQIEKTQVLLTGLENKVELIKNKGLDGEFLNRLALDNKTLAIYNEELDKLKSELKAKTIQTNKKILEVKAQVREAKKIIKRDFMQPQWKGFGIIDKR